MIAISVLYILICSFGSVISLKRCLASSGRILDIYIFSFLFCMWSEYVCVLLTELRFGDLMNLSYMFELGVYWNITNTAVRLWQTETKSRHPNTKHVVPLLVNLLTIISFSSIIFINPDSIVVYVYSSTLLLAIGSGIFLITSGIKYIAPLCFLTVSTELSHLLNAYLFDYELFFLYILEGITGVFAAFCSILVLRMYYSTSNIKQRIRYE